MNKNCIKKAKQNCVSNALKIKMFVVESNAKA